MKSVLNSACISAILCGAVLVALPVMAADVGGSVSTGGMTTSGDLDSATAGNNAGSVNAQAQTPAHHMTAHAGTNESMRSGSRQAMAGSPVTRTAGGTTDTRIGDAKAQ